MAGLSLAITWTRTPEIVFRENGEEIARIKFLRSGKGNARKVNIEAKPSIKISREYKEKNNGKENSNQD